METDVHRITVPEAAWEFADRLGGREVLADLLERTWEHYRAVSEIVVEYTEFDPTYGDEQMTAIVGVLPGGKVGADADLGCLEGYRERFSPELFSRITPVSHPVTAQPTAGNGRA